MSRYLLDTHVWLWMTTEPERLSTNTRAIVDDESNQLLLSTASTWEIAIKFALGKLALPDPPSIFIPEQLRQSTTTALNVELSHTLRVAELPDLHRDPFDRLIIAQAQILKTPIITADAKFDGYDVTLIAA